MTNEKYKARYDSVAHYYEGVMGPLQRWGLVGLREETLRQLPAGRILEIGAGTGLNFVHYPPEAHGVAGEFSREMLKIASTKPRPPRVQLVRTARKIFPSETIHSTQPLQRLFSVRLNHRCGRLRSCGVSCVLAVPSFCWNMSGRVEFLVHCLTC